MPQYYFAFDRFGQYQVAQKLDAVDTVQMKLVGRKYGHLQEHWRDNVNLSFTIDRSKVFFRRLMTLHLRLSNYCPIAHVPYPDGSINPSRGYAIARKMPCYANERISMTFMAS